MKSVLRLLSVKENMFITTIFKMQKMMPVLLQKYYHVLALT